MKAIIKSTYITILIILFMRLPVGKISMIIILTGAQVISIALFYSSIFSQKAAEQFGQLVGIADANLVITGVVLGALFAVILELASLFWAIIGLKWESLAAALVSAFLSVATYHKFFFMDMDWMMLVGIVLFGIFPPIFIVITSHNLSESIHKELNICKGDTEIEKVLNMLIRNMQLFNEASETVAQSVLSRAEDKRSKQAGQFQVSANSTDDRMDRLSRIS
ncbi:hypothetical protein V6R21_20030 [Limibacter armeniacum]|uniref:hypothetical protein n=1 Tax=Limibacter armeniacum TaxID=466084 RepID=UPI002FE6B1DF